MYVLGIETSCDETSVAVVSGGREILSNRTSSSLKFHKKYGGIVPEIASRMQLETIAAVADSAIKDAGINLKDIGLVSVTKGPGLLGSLLVGISFAKSVSLGKSIPLVGVNHLHAHIYASFTRRVAVKGKESVHQKYAALPFVGLVVSGGHTSLFYVQDFDKISLLGSTSDDACGEAFDKVAKLLRLGYPGGPAIEQAAIKGNAQKIKFSCSNANNPLDFSFSGIKTAVLYYLKKQGVAPYPISLVRDVAASFQETVIDTIIRKAISACRIKKVNDLVIGGGVTANNRLRDKFISAAKINNLKVHFPDKELSLDNAAMVAGLGYIMFKRGNRSGLNFDTNQS